MGLLALAVAFPVGLLAMLAPESQRWLLAASLAAPLIILMLLSPGRGVALALVYLALLGGLRRWLIPALGWSPTDPLLLVVPVTVTGVFGLLVARRRLGADTLLARVMLLLLMLMVLQIANPMQGGLTVGVTGALFSVVPLLWYYIGRAYGSPRVLLTLFRVAVYIAIAAAVYGMVQALCGFTQGEVEWIRRVEYGALYVQGRVRPFSFFTSAAEYAQFVGFAVVLLWSGWLRGCRTALFPIPLLIAAMFLEASRGIFITTLIACTVVWAIQSRNILVWFPRWLTIATLGTAALLSCLHQLHDLGVDARLGPLVRHQTSGLLHPLDGDHSTLQQHLEMVTSALQAGVRNPLGHGLGATTLAARKFGVGTSSAEVDVVDRVLTLGLAGGLLYAVVIVVVLQIAFRLWHQRRTLTALGAVGILIAGLGQWLNGGQYATTMLIWFCIGTLDQLEREHRP